MPSSKIGRFDQSFVLRMIRDFVLLLVAVTAVELGLRYAAVVYEFQSHDRAKVDLAAKQLAADVKSIMMNAAGPVAARTVYPILKRNFEDMGLALAIVPSALTVSSMKARFDMEPQGVHPRWAPGKHNEATIPLTADQFCLGCHIHARVGDVLGHVTVRSYLATKLTAWWAEVRLMSMLWAINIITHTVVLFLLLKIRMEPLLSLRSTVAALAKGIIDLSHRARVKSADEFGELALDLNHFLDRIVHIVEDLDRILTTVVAASRRLEQVSGQMNAQFEGIQHSVQLAIRHSLGEQAENAAPAGGPGAMAAMVSSARSGDALMNLSREVHGFAHFLGEMDVLEEKMRIVAQSGQTLLDRLTHTHHSAAAPFSGRPSHDG